MKLYATSDLHVGYRKNREIVEAIGHHPGDWLVLAGDVGERASQLAWVLDIVQPRFAKVVWVPGNHELWTMGGDGSDEPDLRGVAKYDHLVALCRQRGVLTPEDPYPLLPWADRKTALVPMFLLYDYSLRPRDVAEEDALAWAAERGLRCADEDRLLPDPYPTRKAWCEARLAATRDRLDSLPKDTATVLVNHFPLRRRHAVLPLAPRFTIWCGTDKTDDWHVRFRARAVVYGHLHIARTHWDDGVPFDEVSLGYPQQQGMRRAKGVLREILPAL